MKEYWVWSVNDKKKYKIKGKPVKIVDWLDTFVHKNLEVQTGYSESICKRHYPELLWTVAELKTGALFAVGRTQKEAIMQAKEVLEEKGDRKAIRARNKLIKKYGILNEGE